MGTEKSSLNSMTRLLAWMLVLCAVNNIFMYTPFFPQMLYYAVMIMLNGLLLFTNMSKPTSVGVGMWLFWIIMWVSILLNYNTLPAVFRAEQRTVAFFGAIMALGPWFLCRQLVELRLYIWESLNKCLFFMIMLSFLGKLGGFLPSDNNGYYLGCFAHSMILAPLSALVCLNCLHKSVSGKELKEQRFWGGCSVAAFAVTLFASSRTSLISVVFAAFIYFTFQISRKSGAMVKNILLFAVILSIISSAVGGLLTGIKDKQANSQELRQVMSSREDLWNARFQEIKESPLFGVGSHSVKIEYTDKDGKVEPGNAWLFAWSSMGIFSLLVLLGMVANSFFNLRSDIQENRREISALLLAQVSFFALYMNGEAHITAAGDFTYLYFWLLIGIALGIRQYLPKEHKEMSSADA